MKITYLICSFLQAVALAEVIATHTNFMVPSTSETSASFSRGLSTSCHESSLRGNLSTPPVWESTFTWVTSTVKTSLSTHGDTLTASTSSEIASAGTSIGTSTGYASLSLNASTTFYLSSHHGTDYSTRPSVVTSLITILPTDMESFPTFGPSPTTVKTASAKFSFSRSAISTVETFTPSSNSIVTVSLITTLLSSQSSGYTASPWSNTTTYPLGTGKLTATQLYPSASSFVIGKPSQSSFTSSASWSNKTAFIPSTYLPPPPPPNHRTSSSIGFHTSDTASTSGY